MEFNHIPVLIENKEDRVLATLQRPIYCANCGVEMNFFILSKDTEIKMSEITEINSWVKGHINA